jgi:glutamine---fructose-6-phosphate transaminase (isomerizing)
MCGIVGYIGEKKAKPILIDGLKKLEYRGYDSAGVAFIRNGEFEIERTQGKLSCLVEKLNGRDFPATIGIGHTRWATHGRPDEINAHPHYSKDVVLVHNGIIENYKKLKDELITKGHKVESETDTEIICHLIQDFLNQGYDFQKAIRSALKELHGAYSLVILNRNDNQRIYCARKGSPLVLGFNKGENFVASDIPALLSYTNEVAFLHDTEMAILEKEQVSFYDFEGNPIEKERQIIQWNMAQAEKSGYKHFMLKEIHEQPRVIADTLLGRVDLEKMNIWLDDAGRLMKKFVQKPDFHIHIVACGTSWHAGMVARYWIENLAKVPVSVELSSEFRYRQPLVGENTLVVAISQSGETADTLAAIRESKKMGAQVLSICNVIESSIPRESDVTIYTHAGPEIGVASTKAFTTQIAVLYMMAVKLALQKKLLNDHDTQERMKALVGLPSILKTFLRHHKGLDAMTEYLRNKEHCYFIGRGIQYPIILEGALKLKEISYIHADGYAGGEMKHGPIALMEDGVPVVATMLKDDLYEKMISNVQEIKSRGAFIMGIITQGDEETKQLCDLYLEVPQASMDLLPFVSVLPLQLLAYHVADAKGTDVDQPRNLAKSVTVE